MRKVLFIVAVLLLAVAAFGFGCDQTGELGKLADQAGDLKESFDHLKESAANLQSEIESQLPATPETSPTPTSSAEIDEPSAPPVTTTGTKIITVWLRDGVRNATVNGQSPEPGIDNKLEINPDEPLVAEWDYTDSYGREGHAKVDLDSYYSYFVLRELGGWSQTIHEPAYENDKVSGLMD